MIDLIVNSLLDDVRQLIDGARARAAAAVNAELTVLYWQIGRRIFLLMYCEEREPVGLSLHIASSFFACD